MNELLIILAMAVLAIQIAYDSTLAQDVKKLLRIDYPTKFILAAKQLKFWNRVLSIYLFPISCLLVILFSIYYKVIQAIQCSRCLSFWLSSVAIYFYTNNPVVSILWGLVTIIAVVIIEKIDT